MKMTTGFTAIARCVRYDKTLPEPELTSETIDIELHFDQITAANLLFRFSPSTFKLEDYKVLIKFNEKQLLSGITMFKGDYIYIVKNMNQLLSDCHEGYIRLMMMDKFADIMEFDFKAGMEFLDPPKDEFEDET